MTKRRPRGLGRIYRRGRIYWIQYSFRGEKHWESSGSEKESAAVAVGKASDKLAALKLQQRNKNLVTGLLVGSLALLLLRGLSQDQD